MKYLCGIDSGKQGAFVIIDSSGKIAGKYVMPLKGKDLDLDELCDLIQLIQLTYNPLFVLEQLQPIYGAGKSSMWSMCNTYSIIHGMLHALKLNYILIKAKAWQKRVILPEDKVLKKSKKGNKMVNDTKATSLKCFQRLYPGISLLYGDNERQGNRRSKQNEGFVDSLLIARSQLK